MLQCTSVKAPLILTDDIQVLEQQMLLLRFFFFNWVFGKGSDMIAKFINFIHHSEERTGRGSLMCNIWISLNIGAAA